MCFVDIKLTPKNWEGWNGDEQVALGLKHTMRLVKETLSVLDMLQNIEERYGGERVAGEFEFF
jgi:hypothetical protein